MNRRVLAVVTTIALGSLDVSAVPVSAQTTREGKHPAHIHAGLCPTPGDVVQPLSDVATPRGPAMGQASKIPVEVGITENIQMPLADILAGEHSINVHQSADAMDVYIACGDIGGLAISPTDLAIGLAEQNDSGHTGVARLHDNGDGTTTVTVYLLTAKGMTGAGASPTPGASPTVAPAQSPDASESAAPSHATSLPTSAAGTTIVTIGADDRSDIDFEPARAEVTAGASVVLTFQNTSSYAHNLTFGDPINVATDTVVPPGESDTIEFTAPPPGDYTFVCTLHSGMDGVLTVLP